MRALQAQFHSRRCRARRGRRNRAIFIAPGGAGAARRRRIVEAAGARVRKVHESGAALECFQKNVQAQGGDARVCDDPAQVLPLTDASVRVESARSGFVAKVNTEEIGHAIAEAGGGRIRIEDRIDPAVGFVNEVKIGDTIRAGELVGLIYCDDSGRGRHAAERIQAAYEIDESPPTESPSLIKEVIED